MVAFELFAPYSIFPNADLHSPRAERSTKIDAVREDKLLISRDIPRGSLGYFHEIPPIGIQPPLLQQMMFVQNVCREIEDIFMSRCHWNFTLSEESLSQVFHVVS